MEDVKKGDRIRCVEMVDDPNPVEPGTEGTVDHIDGIGQIHVTWDNGRTLALIPGVDKYEIIEKVSESRKIKDWKSFNN